MKTWMKSAAVVLVFLLEASLPHARQAAQTPMPPATERAQDQRPPQGSPFSTLPGFTVTRVTPVEKVDSYIVITFDSLGRPVVSQSVSGNGTSPRLLIDNNGDGIFESEKILNDKINTCHGLWFEGRTLYANCIGPRQPEDGPAPAPAPAAPPAGAPAAAPGAPGAPPQGGGGRGGGGNGDLSGLWKLTDNDGDDTYETLERITKYASGGMGDHGPHAIRRAPDGGILMVIGNNTFVTDDKIDLAATPNARNLKERQFLPAFRDPRFGNSTKEGIHGPVLRLNPATKKFSIEFSGLRNTYDFAFNAIGEGFLYDSDMEWDVNAPWYRQLRTVHIIPGGDNGYRNGTGKFQDEYFDTLPALRDLRRGSPVGVEFYQSYTYPSKFFDMLLEADWSRGRLLYTTLAAQGATFEGRQDLAEFIHGEPMPITDVEVGPDGNVYFTTGGAAANGGLYKVTWTGAKPAAPDMTGVLGIVRQPQPLSSWSWAAIEKTKGMMGAAFGPELEKLARTAAAAPLDRSRALLEMQRHGAAPNGALLRALSSDRDSNVRATVMYVAGAQTTADAKAVAAAGLKDTHPLVQRRAAEALVRQSLAAGQSSSVSAPVADVYALLASPDRFVRYSARLALEHMPREQWRDRVMAETNLTAATEGMLALINTKTSEADLRPIFDRTIALLKRPGLTADQKIRLLRTFEVGATETASGVDPEIKKQIHDVLIPQFPATAPAQSYADCSGQMPNTTASGCALTMLAHHLAKVLAYTGEPDVVSKVFAIMPKGDDDQPGQIDYIYALRVVDKGWTAADKQQLIAWFGKASKWRGGSTFAGHVNNIFDAAIDVLNDAEKLQAYQAAPLFAPLSPEEIAQAAAGGGRGGRGGGANANAAPGAAGAPPAGAPPTGAPPAGAPPAGAPPAAGANAANAAAPPAAGNPAAAGPGAGRGGPGGGGGGGGRGGGNALPATARNVPLDRQERLDNLIFPRGSGPGVLAGRGGGPNAANGEGTFKTACASCHKFNGAGEGYGPDLTTIGTTLQRREILRAIFFPNEKVDPKYHTTVVATRDGKTVRGLLVSETAQAVTLKPSDAPTVTIEKGQIASRRTEAMSIMPDDLIDKIGGDANIANVVAYLMGGR